MQAFEDNKEKLEEMMDADLSRKKLQHLMSKRLLLRSQLSSGATWSHAALDQIKGMADKRVDEAAALWTSKTEKALNDGLGKLNPVKGGSVDGKLWSDGLALASWDEFQKHAAEILTKQKHIEIKSLIAVVEKVSIDTSREGAPHVDENPEGSLAC